MDYCEIAVCMLVRPNLRALPRPSPRSSTHDFIVIDAPGAGSYLTRLAHSMADTLVTPLNDSFVDFDVLAIVDPQTFAMIGTGHYAEMVREAWRQRRIVDGKTFDWVVVRNRLSLLGSRNNRSVGEGVSELARQLGFRFIDGFAERCLPGVLPTRPERARQYRRRAARHAP